MNKPLKKTAVLIAVLCIAMLAATVVFFWPKHLYHIDSAEVEWIYLANGNKVTGVDITDREQIEEIIDLVNGYTYFYSVDRELSSGWSYWLTIETEAQQIQFYFDKNGDYIKENQLRTPKYWHGSNGYFGRRGYLQKLVDLAESTTEPHHGIPLHQS